MENCHLNCIAQRRPLRDRTFQLARTEIEPCHLDTSNWFHLGIPNYKVLFSDTNNNVLSPWQYLDLSEIEPLICTHRNRTFLVGHVAIQKNYDFSIWNFNFLIFDWLSWHENGSLKNVLQLKIFTRVEYFQEVVVEKNVFNYTFKSCNIIIVDFFEEIIDHFS